MLDDELRDTLDIIKLYGQLTHGTLMAKMLNPQSVEYLVSNGYAYLYQGKELQLTYNGMKKTTRHPLARIIPGDPL